MNKIFILFFLLVFNYSNSQWISLINDDLKDWEIKQGNAQFKINQGVIYATSILNSPSTYLGTKDFFSDFILEYEIFASSGLNSGVQFRSLVSDKGLVYGYQCELDTDEFRSWTGGIYDQSRRNLFLYPLTRNEKGKSAFKNGKWNKVRIEAIGSTIRTWVNGIQCANLIDDTSKTGFIAMQIHSIRNKEDQGKIVKWKNMRIMESNLQENRWPVENYATEINYLDNYLSNDQISKGWRFLWDGKTSFGWRGAKLNEFPKNGWIMEDGLLKVVSSGGLESGGGGDIVTISAQAVRPRGPGQWMDPGALGSLGVGTGFSMAAKLAHPNKEVVCLYGDGSFGMTAFDMETAQRFGAPYLAIVGNNSAMNQIRYGQISKYGSQRGGVGNKLGDVDFSLFGKMIGGYGEEVSEASQIQPALLRAREAIAKTGKCAVVNVWVDPNEYAPGTKAQTMYK